jgi:hypothetical protein
MAKYNPAGPPPMHTIFISLLHSVRSLFLRRRVLEVVEIELDLRPKPGAQQHHDLPHNCAAGHFAIWYEWAVTPTAVQRQ